jgi:YD repeat-containing protein
MTDGPEFQIKLSSDKNVSLGETEIAKEAERLSSLHEDTYGKQRLPKGTEGTETDPFRQMMTAATANSYDNVFAPLDGSLPYRITDTANGGKVIGLADRVMGIKYPDGTARQFAYDGDGALVAVKQPNGVVWLRDENGDSWTSSQGRRFKGIVGVNRGGDYYFGDSNGETYKIAADGTSADQASQSELAEGMRSVFDKVDSDGDGHIGRHELNFAFIEKHRNNHFTSSEVEALSFLSKHYARMLKLNPWENFSIACLFGVDNGVTRNDIATYDQLLKVRARPDNTNSI